MNIEDITNRFSDLTGLKLLKKGGQKTVYAALSNVYGPVVLKLMKATPRIDREVAIVKQYGFTGVPKIYDMGEVCDLGDFSMYIVEQRVDGVDLKQYLQNNNAPVDAKFVIRMMRSLFVTLGELEDKGIVHRDIKPDNIIVDSGGMFWLLDFGIARVANDISLTRTDAVHGPCTPGYGAPEQVLNYKAAIDSRADLYSLGVTAYELLTGINPFHRDVDNPLGAMIQSVTLEVQTLDIPEDSSGSFAKFIKMMMNKNKSFRPPNVKRAYEWFERVVEGIA